ncbi:MAG TPA: hypothetical protein VN923_02160 [Thermoanaerobaculia bacterium]|nr:hypothetical protein [Thermoanaerobaculia bacterium]
MSRWTLALLGVAGCLAAACSGSRHAATTGATGSAASAAKETTHGVGFCGSYCDDANNPCDPNSGCTCAHMTNTCEPRFNWCTSDEQCQAELEQREARCVNNACWAANVNCQSARCKEGYGCIDDQDCDPGLVCSAGIGVCNSPNVPNPCPPDWTSDPSYGCVPPASWPVATYCREGKDNPPTCLLCDKNPWAAGNNCPTVNGAKTYLYLDLHQYYCCVESPDEG